MELEAQVFEAERDRARQIWRENERNYKTNEAEDRERRYEIEGEENMRFLGEKLQKMKESRAKHDVKVRKMETKTNKTLEDLRVYLVRFLPE